MKAYAYIGLALTVLIYHKWALINEYSAGETAERSFWQQRYIDSKKDADKRLQTATDSLTKSYQVRHDELSTINATLVSTNAGLRNRKDRMPAATAASCQGASGKELSRDDSAVLTGEFAECQRQQVNLKAHYDYVDTVEKLYRQP